MSRVQTGVAGSNGYGVFAVDANGAWTYATSTAHDEFVDGQFYSDSITVETTDGTQQVVTVTITGTDDRTVITGTSTADLTETDAMLTTGGQLTASDPDSSNAFTAQAGVAGSNNYGMFSIGTTGVWTYATSTAHEEFVDGQLYTDSITVATAAGT